MNKNYLCEPFRWRSRAGVERRNSQIEMLWREIDEGGIRVCGDSVSHYFWYGYAEISILICGIAVF